MALGNNKIMNPAMLQLYQSLAGYLGKDNFTQDAIKQRVTNKFGDSVTAASQAYLDKQNNIANLVNTAGDPSVAPTYGNLGTLALSNVTNHPFATAGLVGLGAGNIGGLTDNNKFGGQIGGLALGGLGAASLASGNPYAAAMMTLGGGELGALFDKLRAKKEQSKQPYQGYER